MFHDTKHDRLRIPAVLLHRVQCCVSEAVSQSNGLEVFGRVSDAELAHSVSTPVNYSSKMTFSRGCVTIGAGIISSDKIIARTFGGGGSKDECVV